jgi:archaemetzincin
MKLLSTNTAQIGHCFGIDHCGYWSCMMQSSGNLAEDDEQVRVAVCVCD